MYGGQRDHHVMQYLLLGAAGAAAGAVIFCNLSAWLVPKAQLATLDYLAQAKLQTINSAKTNFSEAKQLSSLHDVMVAHGVGLHAVVHETLGAEEFKPFFKGDVYYDPKRIFYGPVERWSSIPGVFNFITLSHIFKSLTKDTKGNLEGEGRLMGAVFVIGPGNAGILYQHHETVIGDTVDISLVKDAIKKIKKIQ